MATVTVVDKSQPRLAPAHRPRRRSRRLGVLGALIVIVSAGLWVALGAPAPGARPKPVLVARQLPIGVNALARLAPEGEVIAVAPGNAADGERVDRLLVAVGDKVLAGQVIAVLDTFARRVASVSQAKAQVEVARAKLAQSRSGPKPEDVQAQEALIERSRAEVRAAERDLSRIALLVKRSAGSAQEFDDQTLKYETARETLRQSRAQLAALKAIRAVDVNVAEAELSQSDAALAVALADQQASEVRSPISGRVLRIHVRPGERVAEQGIVEVGNIDVMHAVAEVYEKDVSAVRIGQTARVRVPSLDTELAGEVVHKDLVVGRKIVFNNDPVADTDARVVEVRIRLDPAASLQVAGLSNARAEVVIDVKGGARAMNVFRNLPVAWLQLSHGRTKLLAAVVGIVFADLLMWMQLGFLGAAIESATSLYEKLSGELVVINPLSHEINTVEPFSRRLLARAGGHPEVASVAPLYTGMVRWKDPATGDKRPLLAYGIVPYAPALRAPGVVEFENPLHAADTCLFDLRARPEFQGVAAQIAAGQPLSAEVNGRRLWVVGTTAIGASFAVDGNLVTTDANFLRLFPARLPGSIDIGVVRLIPGSDAQQVKGELQKLYGTDLLVLSIAEFAERATDFLLKSRPINFIFTLGAFVGFLVGFAIVYQVLFTDVSNHLPQYATLKAIGYSDGYLRGVVLQESLILSVLGFLPGAALAAGLYAFTVKATNLPMHMTATRGVLIFGLTVTMCTLSGLLAMRKIRQADPADVF